MKPVSRKQAKKIITNKGTVYKVEKGTNKKAKSLVKEANLNKKIVRHDGHKLKDGKTGMDHFQTQPGNGGHVNYTNAGALATVGSTNVDDSTSTNEDSNDTNSDAEVLVDKLSNPATRDAFILGNAGKLIIGNNKIGKMVDDWINPFSIVDDVNTAIINSSKSKKNE